MNTYMINRLIIFALLHRLAFAIASQDALSPSPPPFPVSANTTFPFDSTGTGAIFSSNTLIATGVPSFPTIELTDGLSSSSFNISSSETSTYSPSSVNTTTTATGSAKTSTGLTGTLISSLKTSPYSLSSVNTAPTPTGSVTASNGLIGTLISSQETSYHYSSSINTASTLANSATTNTSLAGTLTSSLETSTNSPSSINTVSTPKNSATSTSLTGTWISSQETSTNSPSSVNTASTPTDSATTSTSLTRTLVSSLDTSAYSLSSVNTTPNSTGSATTSTSLTGTLISSQEISTNSPSSANTASTLGNSGTASTSLTGTLISSHETSTNFPSSINTVSTPTNSVTASTSLTEALTSSQGASTNSAAASTSLTETLTSPASTSSENLSVSTSDTATITNGPSSTESNTLPSGSKDISSSAGGIILLSGITLRPDPSTTLLPTGTEIQSSASDMSVIIAGIFPVLHRWIEDPNPPQVTGVTAELDNILPKASGLLGKLPIPTGGVEPCKSGKRRRDKEVYQGLQTLDKRNLIGDVFDTAFSLVACVIDTTNKIKDGVIKGRTDIVKTLEDDLKPMVDALNDIDPNKPTSSKEPSSTQSDSSSSTPSSCTTLNTVSNCNIACTATATTTVGGARRRADNNVCTTVCDTPITKCHATGVTTTSSVTSTTTAFRLCAKGCSNCNAAIPSAKPITGGDYLSDTNGLAYAPARTVSALPTDINAAARGIASRETGTSHYGLHKRALTNPNDKEWGGKTEKWLVETISQPGCVTLLHGDGDEFSTSLTDQLANGKGCWNLGGLHGCSAVVVVSRKRIFMTHIWEDPTMENKDGNFQRDAINALRNKGGDGKGVTQGLEAFTGPGGDFENTAENHIRAMVIALHDRKKANPGPEDLEYKDRVEELRVMLKDTLSLPDIKSIPVIPYEDRGDDEDEEGNKLGNGRLLIQYDAAQAMEQKENESCPVQAAKLEVWFEENSAIPQYEDTWTALANQLVNTQPGHSRRLLRGREVTNADEEEWQEFKSVLRRQDGACARPSGTSSASSIARDPTTLQTSFSSTGTSTGVHTETSTEAKTETSTEAKTETSTGAKTETSTEAHTEAPMPTETPLPPKTKAISIILQTHMYLLNVNGEKIEYSGGGFWLIFSTPIGVPVLCRDERDAISRVFIGGDTTMIDNPPWPGGIFPLTLDGMDCEYKNDGTNPGALWCRGRDGAITCQQDDLRWSGKREECEHGNPTMMRHPVVFCEW